MRLDHELGGNRLQHFHPDFVQASVECSSCGNTFTIKSNRADLLVDVCSNCHPAYTGVERPIRAGSRIERFERRRAVARPVARA
jgi:large subunit ribosomal protein L31